MNIHTLILFQQEAINREVLILLIYLYKHNQKNLALNLLYKECNNYYILRILKGLSL